ncbi:MAG: hypothetical protein K0R34_1266 [Herbinix sp.]|jgi:hypothetical protein|nr:hypothetical protein [Herbinix sp.]
MKKLLAITILGITLLSSSGTAFAANNVSQMAVNKGGQSVAECAKMMDKGVSECVNSSGCNMQ